MIRVQKTHKPRVPIICGLAIAVAFCAGAWADETLAPQVPADVGIFAEIHNAPDLLTTLTEPRIWTTLAELAGQPADPRDAAFWRQRIQQTVGMEPNEAIKKLLARGVAFVAPGRSQDAGVLCLPPRETSIDNLLKQWNARPLEVSGNPPAYHLAANIGVINYRGLLFFGDVIPARGMFRQMQTYMASSHEKSLANDPDFRKLRLRVPANPDGLLFVRLNRAAPTLPAPLVPQTQPGTASQPGTIPGLPALPGPLHNAQNILVSLHRSGQLLRFMAVGDGTDGTAASAADMPQLIGDLPQRTLFAWQGQVDYPGLVALIKSLPATNAVRNVFNLEEQLAALDQFAAALAPHTCVAIGAVHTQQREPGAPPMPAAALLISTRDPGHVEQQFRTIVDAGIASYSVFAFARGLPLLNPIADITIGNQPAHLLDLSPLLKPQAKQAIGQVHLCWAIHDGVLIVASHRTWLEQLIAAREGKQPRFLNGDLAPLMQSAAKSKFTLAIQTGPIADLGQLWLDYVSKINPDVFSEQWWRTRQPGGTNVQIGITATPDTAHRRLRVEQVLEHTPATGRLRVGDQIVGHGNIRFATDDPVAEFRAALKDRPLARRFELLIERDGRTIRVILPLPFINPALTLQRLVAIGHIAQRAVYYDDYSDTNGPRGALTIEMRTDAKPLFDFTPPTSNTPATTPPAATPEPAPTGE